MPRFALCLDELVPTRKQGQKNNMKLIDSDFHAARLCSFHEYEKPKQ